MTFTCTITSAGEAVLPGLFINQDGHKGLDSMIAVHEARTHAMNAEAETLEARMKKDFPQ